MSSPRQTNTSPSSRFRGVTFPPSSPSIRSIRSDEFRDPESVEGSVLIESKDMDSIDGEATKLDFSTVDYENIASTLTEVNPFRKYKDVNHDLMLMLEITDKGEINYKNMQLRELLDYVNREAKAIDRQNGGYGVGRTAALRQRSVKSMLSLTSRLSTGNSAQNLVSLVNPASVTGGGSSSGSDAQQGQAEQIQSGTTPPEDYVSAVNPLRIRDLRKLDVNDFDEASTANSSTLLVRWHALLFCFEPIRAIVMSTKLIWIVPNGADSLLELVQEHMMQWVEACNSDHAMTGGKDSSNHSTNDINNGAHAEDDKPPFEAHALDALFTTVTSLQDQEYKRINSDIQLILGQFKQKGCILSIDAQEKMRSLKNRVSRMLQRLGSYRSALEDAVDDDEEMALMNLSILHHQPKYYSYPLHSNILGTHEEMEGLLESYLQRYMTTCAKLEYLRAQMQSAEDLVYLRLDTSRNQLLVVNTMFGILACCIAIASYVTGAFGMNLDNVNTLQNQQHLFVIVFVCSFSFLIVMFVSVVYYLRQRSVLPSEVSKVY
jgi:hypothetical protein